MVDWPPENVLLGVEGPRFWRHKQGVVCQNAGKVCLMIGELWAQYPVSNKYGARNTMNQAIKLYDPFQNVRVCKR